MREFLVNNDDKIRCDHRSAPIFVSANTCGSGKWITERNVKLLKDLIQNVEPADMLLKLFSELSQRS
ncbi:PxORF1 peptide [Plutella xylostella granulovirus]|uniref:ORF1 protein n=1 Tax=Plutella xylostella granulovirus TaxID=98383 RepID=Q9JGU9_9BBAC|nr:PxORF1 peptide [Plutella xylostella granulovirus]AAG27299.1 PxORF1 peptide [Plutella xylostella granulovirus]AMQ35613.1 PxGV-Corf1 protein [Plutella xylostella granulovirus]AMQ35730.1 PxGV-Korf1 protein [Plutella xylostella granulovirus]AMQ35847.1 PxGV-Morf1 protein [Plutella xylostella granulovirus]AMQ35964.1 PxGV-Torf1 protein [Plutella xylostella granulovirus]